MASVVSQFIEEVTAHAQSDSLEDVGEICADGTYLPNKLCSLVLTHAMPRAKTQAFVIYYDSFFQHCAFFWPQVPQEPFEKPIFVF